jgi:hypothetical protein
LKPRLHQVLYVEQQRNSGFVTLGLLAQVPALLRSPQSIERLLPSSTDCWEPAVAVGPREQIYVVSGRRSATSGSKSPDQQPEHKHHARGGLLGG